MSTLKKNIVFIAVYFVGVAAYLWFDPIATEYVSDRGGVLIPVTGLVGLVWANARSFPWVQHWWRRTAARAATTGVMFVGLCVLTYAYSWHIRPALGLQCKTTAVANKQVDGARP